MDNGEREESVRKAFSLFEEGKYRESLAICLASGQPAGDTQIAILTARNLYYLGRIEEAEAHVRDLLCRMPESSYLHSFLGKILEGKDEDAAVAEYVQAVTLDPGNQEALRSYAACLVAQRDFRKAVPVQKKLAALSGREEDYRLLVQSLIAAGQAKEALSVYRSSIRRKDADRDHIGALMAAGIYPDAAKEALAAYQATGSVDFARTYLQAHARNNPEAALQEYKEFFSVHRDTGIGYDYATLLLSMGKAAESLGVCRDLLDSETAGSHPRIRLLLCRVNAMVGEREKALGCFEHLIREALANLDDPGFLSESACGIPGVSLHVLSRQGGGCPVPPAGLGDPACGLPPLHCAIIRAYRGSLRGAVLLLPCRTGASTSPGVWPTPGSSHGRTTGGNARRCSSIP